ncbi:hypothetical protein DEU56DRAFT_907135 [Suillus clintonianus]|uniref:uncharacterized protein n=1 Tax=Suillus clintonianus TaxID=1904413 RepID=UPI001B85F566|nr:uncharacterized protein DEU56DRAFT_907135 [Suillus clintonianus]KAG2154749.1 hypothetical protein DEU56DRAFT_907135 [Suillus clintonianus]
MSNSQPSDARAALMESVFSRYSQASPGAVSPGSLLRRPSRNFNAQDSASHRKQAASPSKRKAREDKIGLLIRGRTIYSPKADPATHSAPKTSSLRKSMKPTASSRHPFGTNTPSEEKLMPLDILQRMDAEEDNQKKDPRVLTGGAFTPMYQAHYRDGSVWMGVPESDAHCSTPERRRDSVESMPSNMDMEYWPPHWNAPIFNSGVGDLEAMFEMCIKDEECLEGAM